MYIINSDNLPPERLYKTNGVIANWLMTQKSMPLLSRENGSFIFADTELLREVLKDLPFYLRISRILY